MNKNPKRFYLLMAAMLGVYVALAVVLKPNQATLDLYNLSITKAYIIILSLAGMFAFIWLTAAYGFVHVLEYSQLIGKNKDGRAFRKIALGLGLIAFRSPITSILTNVFNAIMQHNPGLTGKGVIIVNYISVAVAVFGFWLISMGTDGLVDLTQKKVNPYVRMGFRLLALALISAYTYLAIGSGGYQFPTSSGDKPSFYLPSWLIVSTIIVPYAYAWYMAFMASYNLISYSKNVKGVLYKQALRWLAWGMNIIIVNTIIFQFIGAQGSRGNKLSLAPLLALAYVLLISIGIGFAVVAVGAKKLKKIEEV